MNRNRTGSLPLVHIAAPQTQQLLPETTVIEGKAERVADDVSALYNACWFVRRYERGGRVNTVGVYRAQAIQKLGLTCREIFNRTPDQDFEPVLAALVDGLRPLDQRQPF